MHVLKSIIRNLYNITSKCGVEEVYGPGGGLNAEVLNRSTLLPPSAGFLSTRAAIDLNDNHMHDPPSSLCSLDSRVDSWNQGLPPLFPLRMEQHPSGELRPDFIF